MSGLKITVIGDGSEAKRLRANLLATGCVQLLSWLESTEEANTPCHPDAVFVVDPPNRRVGKLIKKITFAYPAAPIIVLLPESDKKTPFSLFRKGISGVLTYPYTVNELLLSLCEIESLAKESQPQASSEVNWWRNLIAFVKRSNGRTSRPNMPDILEKATEQREINSYSHFRSNGTAIEKGQIHRSDIPASPQINVNFLGKFTVTANHQQIQNWPSKKGKSLFAFLLYYHKKRFMRDVLMEEFWPNSNPDCARNCLNVALYGIRRVLQEVDPATRHILYKNEQYFINPDVAVVTDTDELYDVWQKGKLFEQDNQIARAMKHYQLVSELYRGDFMEDDLYENWVSLERDNLLEIYLHVLDRLTNYYSNNGKPATAVVLCKKILRKDNCREDVHRRLMYCYLRLGQRPEALRQYQRCLAILRDELDVSPSRLTEEVYQKIKQA